MMFHTSSLESLLPITAFLHQSSSHILNERSLAYHLFSTYPHGHVQPEGASSLGFLTLPEAWKVLSSS